jgi:hypothetical protein
LRFAGLKTGEAIEIGAEDVALQGEVGELALALDADEAGVFELLHVMGESGGADGLGFAEAGAWRGALATADLGKNLVAAGCSESLGDKGELAVSNLDPLRGEAIFLCGADTLFSHDSLPYPASEHLPEKFNIGAVDIHHALTYRRPMSSSIRIAAQCCCSLLRPGSAGAPSVLIKH